MKRVLAWLMLILVVVAIGASVAWRILTREEPLDLNPQQVRMGVMNGCAMPRLGRAIADELEARGFAVYGTGNTDSVYEHTTVVDLLDPNAGCASKVARALSTRRRLLSLPVGRRIKPEVSVRLDSTRFLEVLVIAGQDYTRFFPDVVVLR